MNANAPLDLSQATIPSARDWARIVIHYGKPSNHRAIAEAAVSFGPFVALWALTAVALTYGYWIALILVLPMAGLLLRIFIIQHDCGHGSYFSSKQANTWLGRFASLFTVTPFAYWAKAHKIHHSGAGSLTRRGIGDIDTLTVAEYRALTPLGKWKYRLYRHPLVMFVIGPAYVFLLDQRLPTGQMKDGIGPWISCLGTTACLAILFAALSWLVGWQVFLAIHLPTVLIAASAGVWLFYVQHQFEETIWEDDENWTFHEAALYGSSHYDLPQPLRWFSGNIGLHHVHHLSSRIPFYRLPAVLRDHPALHEINRMTLAESIKCVPLALWDEDKRMLVGFRAAAAAA